MPIKAKDECFEDILSQYKGTVYSIALTHTKTKNDAEDVFQEVFLAYWKENRKFNSEEHRKAWLIRTCLNLCKKCHRQSLWQRAISLGEAQSFGEGFEFCEKRQGDVFLAVQSMPKKLRTVICLFYFEDMSVKEISRVTGIREGTVRMQLTRGREKLRELLQSR